MITKTDLCRGLRCDLKHRAKSRDAIALRCAVKIPRFVEDQAGIRIRAGLIQEAVKHLLSPPSVLLRGQLEDGAVVVSDAAVKSRAVEPPCLVKDQTSTWTRSVGTVRPRAETM